MFGRINTFSQNKLLKAIYNKLSDNFISYWKRKLYNDDNKTYKNKLRTYRELKSEYVLEKILLLDIQKNIVSNFVKLRISNSNLLIEQGRHQNIPLENRLCPICKLEIENEYHFVIECNKLTSSRSKLYSKVTEIVPNFLFMSDSDKFKYILSSNDYDIMKICVIGTSEMCSERNKLFKSNAK